MSAKGGSYYAILYIYFWIISKLVGVNKGENAFFYFKTEWTSGNS